MTGGSLLGGAQVLIVEDEYLLADDLVRALKKAGADPVGLWARLPRPRSW